MWSVGWEALEQWGDDVARVERLAGGVANDVWRVRVNGRLAVGRLGARSDADLADRRSAVRRGSDRDDRCGGRTAGGGGQLASRGRHAPPLASVDAGLAAAPGLAIVERPRARPDRDQDR